MAIDPQVPVCQVYYPEDVGPLVETICQCLGGRGATSGSGAPRAAEEGRPAATLAVLMFPGRGYGPPDHRGEVAVPRFVQALRARAEAGGLGPGAVVVREAAYSMTNYRTRELRLVTVERGS